MPWIDKSKDWLPSKSSAASVPVAAPNDPLAQLLPDDIKDKSSFNAWEVARICGCHKATVLRWIKEEKLGVVRLPGGKSRIPKSVLQEFLCRYN